MATVAEAIGLALPYSCGAPAPYEMRDRFNFASGEKIMELIAKNIRPRDIVTLKALENAAAVVSATGGSTNAALHLPAIAHEAGIKFDLFDVAKIFEKTPYIADLKPGGKYVAKDMFEAGGIPLLMKTMLDHGYLHGDCLTVTGRTLAENMEHVRWNDAQDVVRPANKPITVTGGVVGLKGNLAPEGAIVKVAGMSDAEIFGPGALLRLGRGVLRGGDATAITRKARFSSSATRDPRAAPACARCCRRRRRSMARAWATRWPSSPMGVSRARHAASASAMSGRRRRLAVRSGC